MSTFTYPGIANSIPVDANGFSEVGGVFIADFPSAFNMALTINNVGAIVKNGSNNTFMGQQSLANTGSNNSFFGAGCGIANTTASNGTYQGYAAGQKNTTGINNTFFGTQAGFNNIAGGNNTFIGYQAGLNNNNSFNTFVGQQAGAITTSGDNCFFGVQAGYNNTTGGLNVFFGELAGWNNTIASNQCFIGFKAGYNVTTGGNNCIIGNSNFDAAHLSGTNNTLIGNGLNAYGNISNTVIISDGNNGKNLTMDTASSRFTKPVRPPQFTVALLPSAATSGVGAIAYATNGRIGAQAAGAGTGCPVYSTGTAWFTFSGNVAVTA